MNARYPRGRPSNMGQENSTLAQQSINTSAGRPRATPTQEMQSSNTIRSDTNHHHAYSTPRGRSRSPGNRSTMNLPLPQNPRVQSLDNRMRRRSPPLTTGHSNGRLYSPGSVRHKFVREEVEDRRQTYDARSKIQQPFPQSPNARVGTRDNAAYQRSPQWRHPSDNYQKWARNAGLPNTPREPLAQRSSVPKPAGNHSVGGTIDHRGLRGVPTGPRPRTSDFTARSPPRRSRIDSPCIFVSLQDLPNTPRMAKHLRGMLGELKPQTVELDDYGWHLVYQDSPDGLEKLTRCFKRYNNELMFSQYKLRMQCYPNGKQPEHDSDIHSSGKPSGSSASQTSHERPDSSMMPRVAGFEARQLTYPKPVKSLGSKVDTVSPRPGQADNVENSPGLALPDTLFNHLSDATRTLDVPTLGVSTPLLSLRSDRDETGSLGSGVTRSDGSRIRRDRCHRCSGESVPGSSKLVRCSTCPRQYHRRCHLDFAIPADLSSTHDWTCASCVKKVIAGKKAPPKENVPKSPSKPKAPILTTDTVPKDASDRQQYLQNNDHDPDVMDVDDTSNAQLQLLRSDSKSPQNDIQSQGDLTTKPKSAILDEHATLSDADDLVTKSFAIAEVRSDSNPPPKKPGKLKITRTKLPPKPPSMTAHQLQDENQADQSSSSVADRPDKLPPNTGFKAANMNEAVTRNSVADLRALAHERHQAAIKNGAEGHFASEEQRPRHNSAEKTPRPSPAQEPTNEIEAPQQKSSTTESGFTAPAVAKHTTEREIPESPDEARRGEESSQDQVVNPRVLALLQPTEIAFVPPARRIPNVAPAQDEKSPAPMRPRASFAVIRCQNCKKTIPKGPTGNNKLCSGCKRDAAAAAGPNLPVDAKAIPQTSLAPLQTSFASIANMRASPQAVAAPAELDPRSEEAIEKSPGEQGPPVSDDGTGRVACDTCREHHKKCTHDNPVAQALKPIPSDDQDDDVALPDESARRATTAVVDGASLTQEAEATTLDQSLVHNPLAAEILGELQFAPTMQTQLREDPSMTESKILLLKQILEENDDAKTDTLLLAKELAEAQRLSFIKSKVGNSYDRPMGARLILVAMALGSTASRRMQAPDVKEWIASTIPGYKKGEGNWESRISSELSQEKLVASGSGYWRIEEWKHGDGGNPRCRWYKLLPEREDEMWKWCPVLKEPLSPSARREARKRGKNAVQPPTSTSASTSGPATPKSSTNEAVSVYCGSFVPGEDDKRLDDAGAEATGNNAMDIDEPTDNDLPQSHRGLKRKCPLGSKMTKSFTSDKNDSPSSEDEPLSASWKPKRRRRETLPQNRATTPTVRQHPRADTELQDQMELEPGMSTTNSAERVDRAHCDPGSASKASGTSVKRRKSGLVILYLNGSRRPSTAGSSDQTFAATRKQLALSLYNEWPEFRQHASDEHDKLAEIHKRPRKKKLFGKRAPHTQAQFGKDSVAQPIVPFNFSPEKRSRTRMVDPRPDEPYPWENPDNDPTRKEYTSLEELFDFPDNMIPIISEGQLAYRDGTRTDDGRLPRARDIFKI